MKNDKVLIGGTALAKLGSSRSTNDVDYLVNIPTDGRMFIHDEEGVDLINANSHEFFAKIWEAEKGNEIASPQSLLELKAFSFVQHCLNGNWQKADDAEYDMKFLVRTFNLSGVKIVNNYIGLGELSEINKVINSVRK